MCCQVNVKATAAAGLLVWAFCWVSVYAPLALLLDLASAFASPLLVGRLVSLLVIPLALSVVWLYAVSEALFARDMAAAKQRAANLAAQEARNAAAAKQRAADVAAQEARDAAAAKQRADDAAQLRALYNRIDEYCTNGALWQRGWRASRRSRR